MLSAKKTVIGALLGSLLLTGCSAANTADTSKETVTKTTVAMKNEGGDLVFNIDQDGDAMIVPDRGIFYSKITSESNNGMTHSYRFVKFNSESNEDMPLGTVEDLSYETYYARTYLDNKVYTLAVIGNMTDGTPDPLWLMEFDLQNGSINKYKVTDNGFPYSYLTSMNGKIVLFHHDQQDTLYDRLIEFDPATGTIREITHFELSNDLQGDSIRALYSEGDKLYVLRLRFEGPSTTRAYVDTYDSGYNKINERDITDIIKISDDNELQQCVSAFRVVDDKYLFYENYSVTRRIADLDTGEIICDIDDPFALSKGGGTLYFYSIMNTPVNGDFDANSIYGFKDGKLTQIKTAICDDGQEILALTSAEDGNMLMVIKDTKDGSIMTKVAVNSSAQ